MKETRDSIADVWGERTPHLHNMWPVRPDVRTLEEPERRVQSACVPCSNGCALDIGVRGGKIVGVRAREIDRVNLGRLAPRTAPHQKDSLEGIALRRRAGRLPDRDRASELTDKAMASAHVERSHVSDRTSGSRLGS